MIWFLVYTDDPGIASSHSGCGWGPGEAVELDDLITRNGLRKLVVIVFAFVFRCLQ